MKIFKFNVINHALQQKDTSSNSKNMNEILKIGVFAVSLHRTVKLKKNTKISLFTIGLRKRLELKKVLESLQYE